MRLFHRDRGMNAYIKDAVDNLPEGICFFDRDGMLVLCNHRMYQLSFALSGHDLQHITELEAMMEHPLPTVMILDRGKTFLLPDGNHWRFRTRQIKDKDGMDFTQVTATNVTELFEKRKELQEDTEKQKQLSRRLSALSENIVALTREEETLRIKMRIHDDIGQSVIATKQVLQQDRPTGELDMSLWRRAVIILLRESIHAPKQDMHAQLNSAADALGIRILMDGEMCSDEKTAYLLIAAIRECMTNAVRHGGADELYVHLEETEKEMMAMITNNGKPPEEKVAEGGGLSSLRQRVENKGGKMVIESSPAFALTVTLPKKGEGL